MPRELKSHGTRACYVRGCRLPECVSAMRKYQKDQHALRRAELKKSKTT